MSQAAGSRADYVQGGSNTSVKLGGGLMAIKASGFRLSDITPRSAYAVLDGDAIREFYLTGEPGQFADVEAAGAARVKECIRPVEGLENLRPSVEAGFHSILRTCVLHTHSVYANLACCATDCGEIAQAAFAGAGYAWGDGALRGPGSQAHLRHLGRPTAGGGGDRGGPHRDPDAEPRRHRPR